MTNTNNTIQGAGNIGDNAALALVNKATIDANASSQTLNLSQGGGVVTNTGTLEATAGGTLQIFTKGSSGINRFEVRGLKRRLCSSIRRGNPRAEC